MEYGLIPKIDQAAQNNQLLVQQVQPSNEIAKLKEIWNRTGKKSMTREELNSFSSELLGFSLDSGISAYRKSLNGEPYDMDLLIDKSAKHNLITPEHARQIIEQYLKY